MGGGWGGVEDYNSRLISDPFTARSNLLPYTLYKETVGKSFSETLLMTHERNLQNFLSSAGLYICVK